MKTETKAILDFLRGLDYKASIIIRHFDSFLDSVLDYTIDRDIEDSLDNMLQSMLNLKEFYNTDDCDVQVMACYIHDLLVESYNFELPNDLLDKFNKLFEETEELYSKLNKIATTPF